jgi:ribonuclease BN (tRNA processing enzyme)
MRLKILGCSGGIARGLHTTSFLVDGSILLDAGTGLGTLSMEELLNIKEVFITHAHLDHIAALPLFIDSVFWRHAGQIKIHALEPTIAAIRKHIFNHSIWPDFTVLPTSENAIVEFMPHSHGETVMAGDKEIELVPVEHRVPATGYIVKDQKGVLVFSGDTTTNDCFWERVGRLQKVDCLIVETAFPEEHRLLAEQSFHYSPSLLADDLQKLDANLVQTIHLTHIKPGFEETIVSECRNLAKKFRVNSLRRNQCLDI